MTLGILTFLGTIIFAVVKFVWWMADQFTETRKYFYEMIVAHEREDERRFASVKHELSRLGVIQDE